MQHVVVAADKVITFSAESPRETDRKSKSNEGQWVHIAAYEAPG